MRILLILTALSFPVSADYVFINIGAGNNTNLTGASIPWDDAGGIGCSVNLGYAYEFTHNLHIGAQWYHVSQCDQGAPFNDNDESSLDALRRFLEYRFDV